MSQKGVKGETIEENLCHERIVDSINGPSLGRAYGMIAPIFTTASSHDDDDCVQLFFTTQQLCSCDTKQECGGAWAPGWRAEGSGNCSFHCSSDAETGSCYAY